MSTSTSATANDKRVILVTGANKGIGYETVKLLVQQLPQATILLGTRSLDNGSKAMQRMRNEDTTASFDNVQPLVIDITDNASIQQAVEHVKATHGQLDIFIHNSGISNLNGDMRTSVILDVNFDGARAAIESFVPIIPPSTGLIILVSSTVGTYAAAGLPSDTQQLLMGDPASLTWSKLQELRDDWQSYLDEKPSRHQWTPREDLFGGYQMSKALLNAWALMYTTHHTNPKLILVCPGFCATDLNHHRGTDTAAKGAQSVTWPLWHADEAVHGRLYQHGRELPFVQDAPQQYKDNTRKMVAEIAAKKAAAQR